MSYHCSFAELKLIRTSTQQALYNGGPIGALLGYSIIGTVVYCLCVSIGEMIAYLWLRPIHIPKKQSKLIKVCHRPNVGGVVGLADLFVDPALGFSLGWAAWVSQVLYTSYYKTYLLWQYNWSITLRGCLFIDNILQVVDDKTISSHRDIRCHNLGTPLGPEPRCTVRDQFVQHSSESCTNLDD